jgi:hypothetical protein
MESNGNLKLIHISLFSDGNIDGKRNNEAGERLSIMLFTPNMKRNNTSFMLISFSSLLLKSVKEDS